MGIINTSRAARYTWQGVCDGWPLVARPRLSVKQERMPPGTCEERHFHVEATQFFYVLSGELNIERDGETFCLGPQDGLEVSARIPHQACNRGAQDVAFLVISTPSTEGDRVLTDAAPER